MNRICISFSIIATCLALQTVDAADFKVGEYTFTLPDGFSIEKVTDESIVKRPISADFDFEGNLYVTEASGTNDQVKTQLENKPHRVLKLSDSNGDGKFDKQTVFVDKIQFPEGALFHRGSLYVTAPPSIWKFTDTDNDGVADKTEEWLNAETLTHCANDLHGPFAGPDGYIYWCKGAFAEQSWPQADGSTFTTKASHIFRKPVDGGFVEPVMTGGMDNPVEVAFTPTGELFFCTTFLQHPGDGKRDGIIHNIHGAVYGKDHGVINGFPRTGDFLPPLVHMGAAAPAGLMSSRSDQLGDDYQNKLFTASFNMHKVTSHRVTSRHVNSSGTGMTATNEDFLVCDSFDFHPTDVLEDADGSLLIVDTGGWYKICCPTSQLYKPEVLGGIYRVRRDGSHKVDDAFGVAIEWGELTSHECCELLKDCRFKVREHAKQTLVSKGAGAIEALEEFLSERKEKKGSVAELEALWILSQIDDSRSATLIRSRLELPASKKTSEVTLGKLGPYLVASRILGTRKDMASVSMLIDGLKDKRPKVRRFSVEALGRIGDASAVVPIVDACRAGEDPATRHAFIYALIEIGDAAKTRSGLVHDNPASVTASLIALDQMPSGNLTSNEVSQLLSAQSRSIRQVAFDVAIRHEEWLEELLPEFERKLTRTQLHNDDPDEHYRFMRAAVKSDRGRELAKRLVNDGEVIDQTKLIVLRALNDVEATLEEVNAEAILRLLDFEKDSLFAERQQRILSETYRLLQRKPALASDESTIARLFELADDSQPSSTMRLRALLSIPDANREINEERWNLIRDNVTIGAESMARTVAAELLRRSKLNRAQLLDLARILPEIGPLEIESALAAFGKSKDRLVTYDLLKMLPETPAFHSVTGESATKLLAGFSDQFQQGLRSLFDKREADKQQQLAALDEKLNGLPPGIAADGQKIFQSATAACSACHTVGYLGGKLGPDLTRIGKTRQKRDLLESVLFPSVSFVRGFEPMIVTTLDGQTHSGFVRDETDQHVVLVNSERKEIRIPRDDIEEMSRGELSIMPAGLDQQLSDQQLADLLEFLIKAQ